MILLAGCTSPASTQDASSEPETIESASAQTSAASIELSLSARALWLRPGDAAILDATPIPQATYAWYLAARSPAPTTATAPPASPNPRDGEPFPRPVYAAGTLPPGETANITLDIEGRYVIRAGAQDHVVIVETPGVEALAIDLASPAAPAMRLAPGGSLRLQNPTDREIRHELASHWVSLAGAGAHLEAAIPYQGDLDAIVLATTPEGSAVAKTRLLLDPMKPDERREYAPMTGSFDAGLSEDPRGAFHDHELLADHPMRALEITHDAAGALPGAPADITVSLLAQDGSAIAASESGATGALALADLPAGRYVVRVTADRAVLVEYEIRATAVFLLEAPADELASAHSHGTGIIDPCGRADSACVTP